MYHVLGYVVEMPCCGPQMNSRIRRIAQIESSALMKQMLMIAT